MLAKAVALRTVELICFTVALGFMIPPIASDERFPHRATPALIIGGLVLLVRFSSLGGGLQSIGLPQQSSCWLILFSSGLLMSVLPFIETPPERSVTDFFVVRVH